MKKKSHLCVGDKKWGRFTNNKVLLKKFDGNIQQIKSSANFLKPL